MNSDFTLYGQSSTDEAFFVRCTDMNYRTFKGERCEDCGFVATVSAQLDVHHVDEDRTNNDPQNLQTLCANCHRAVKHKKPRTQPSATYMARLELRIDDSLKRRAELAALKQGLALSEVIRLMLERWTQKQEAK